MLIGTITMSERGIKVYDVDGSVIDITAQDAFDLSKWIGGHLIELFEIIRREERAAKDAARKEQHGDIQ